MRKSSLTLLSLLMLFLVVGCGKEESNGLIFDESGTYDYADKNEIDEEVHITKTGVILRNMIIDSDLYIDESVGDGHIELHNVEVNGTVHVYGGGLETIYIQDGMILKLIGYVDGRIEAAYGTEIDEVIVKEPGMVLENWDNAPDAFPNVKIDIEAPTLADQPVILDGDFGDVEIKAGANVEIKEETRIKYGFLSHCAAEECDSYETKVKLNNGVVIDKMKIDDEVILDNEGVINEQEFGENYSAKGAMVVNAPTLSVASNGDYSMTFSVNKEGTIYYMIQPWFESAGVSLTSTDIVNKKPYHFQLHGNNGGEANDMQYMVSAKNYEISNSDLSVTVSGYMGDSFGSRPPAEDDISFDSVVWYVFEDSEGNFSEVGKIVYRP